MVAVPVLVVLALVWLPAVATSLLSFTDWNGIGAVSDIHVVGVTNYVNVATNYPPFWPALQHNLIWLAVLFLVATPAGVFLAVLLDKQIRFSRFYQTALYLPVVLSLALTGFVWQLIYSRDQGLLNAMLGTHRRLVRRSALQPVGGARGRELEAHRLRHVAVLGRAQGRRRVTARSGRDRRRHGDAGVLPDRVPGRCGRSTSSSW